MDKKTIESYLVEIKRAMLEGRFIHAYNELRFVLDNFEDKPLELSKSSASDKEKKE